MATKSTNGATATSAVAKRPRSTKVTDSSATVPTISIDRISQETILVPIIGTSPLIMNAWSAKARQAMLDAMQGRRSPRKSKDPEAEYESALYRLKPRRGRGSAGAPKYGFPADAFKQSTIGAARFYGKDVTMTSLKQFIFIHGEAADDGRALVPIVGEPQMREDVVRVGQGTDLRYRPAFYPWSATLRVTYMKDSITRDSVLSLIDAGGLAVGVGEWRPQRNGTFGTYQIDTDDKIGVVK
jgi:hypothetical protein